MYCVRETTRHIIAITNQERGCNRMGELRRNIITMIQAIDDLGTLKLIYQFIRGLKSSH